MKTWTPTRARREVLATSSKRTEWSWVGFGAGLLGYIVVSVVFGGVPEDDALRAVWLGIGLAPASLGLCIGFTLAAVID